MHGQQNIKIAMNVMDEIYYEYVLSLKMAFSRNMSIIIYRYSCI